MPGEAAHWVRGSLPSSQSCPSISINNILSLFLGVSAQALGSKFFSWCKMVLPWLWGHHCHGRAFGTNQILHLKILSYCQLFIHFITLCVWMFCLPVCMCTTCMPGALGDQKGALDPLKLELQVLSFICRLGIESEFSGKATCILNCWPNSPAPRDSSRLRQLGVILRTFI